MPTLADYWRIKQTPRPTIEFRTRSDVLRPTRLAVRPGRTGVALSAPTPRNRTPSFLMEVHHGQSFCSPSRSTRCPRSLSSPKWATSRFVSSTPTALSLVSTIASVDSWPANRSCWRTAAGTTSAASRCFSPSTSTPEAHIATTAARCGQAPRPLARTRCRRNRSGLSGGARPGMPQAARSSRSSVIDDIPLRDPLPRRRRKTTAATPLQAGSTTSLRDVARSTRHPSFLRLRTPARPDHLDGVRRPPLSPPGGASFLRLSYAALRSWRSSSLVNR